MRRLALIVVLGLLAPAPVRLAAQAKPAQAKPEPPKPAPPAKPTQPPPAATPAPAPPQPESYSYDPAGRRDPFLNLLGAGNQPRVATQRGEGKSGLSVAELSVRGVMMSRGSFIAMVQGPDGKTFLIQPGDKLADGTVKSVNAEGLVVVQDVNDPLSLVKQREVSKKLRSLEVKQ